MGLGGACLRTISRNVTFLAAIETTHEASFCASARHASRVSLPDVSVLLSTAPLVVSLLVLLFLTVVGVSFETGSQRTYFVFLSMNRFPAFIEKVIHLFDAIIHLIISAAGRQAVLVIYYVLRLMHVLARGNGFEQRVEKWAGLVNKKIDERRSAIFLELRDTHILFVEQLTHVVCQHGWVGVRPVGVRTRGAGREEVRR